MTQCPLNTPLFETKPIYKFRVVHGSYGPAGRVGSGRVGSSQVTILPDFGGSSRVSTSDY